MTSYLTHDFHWQFFSWDFFLKTITHMLVVFMLAVNELLTLFPAEQCYWEPLLLLVLYSKIAFLFYIAFIYFPKINHNGFIIIWVTRCINALCCYCLLNCRWYILRNSFSAFIRKCGIVCQDIHQNWKIVTNIYFVFMPLIQNSTDSDFPTWWSLSHPIRWCESGDHFSTILSKQALFGNKHYQYFSRCFIRTKIKMEDKEFGDEACREYV